MSLPQSSSQTFRPHSLGIWPGVILAGAIASLSFGLRQLPGFSVLSPMILSILIGIAFRNIIGTPAIVTDGVKFSIRRILRGAQNGGAHWDRDGSAVNGEGDALAGGRSRRSVVDVAQGGHGGCSLLGGLRLAGQAKVLGEVGERASDRIGREAT